MRQYLRIRSNRRGQARHKSQYRRGSLKREGWIERHGGSHDVFKHPTKPGRIVVPRHRTLSPGVARAIAQQAGWH